MKDTQDYGVNTACTSCDPKLAAVMKLQCKTCDCARLKVSMHVECSHTPKANPCAVQQPACRRRSGSAAFCPQKVGHLNECQPLNGNMVQ